MSIARWLDIDRPQDFKLHAARWNGVDQPLEVFMSDRQRWHDWNKWFGGRHEFNRPYILSIIDFYPERGAWIFAGIYSVENYRSKPDPDQIGQYPYKSVLSRKSEDLIGRMKLSLNLSRGRSFLLENCIERMELLEVSRRPYTGPGFPGYENATLSFDQLRSIVRNDRQDWKTALTNMKGVYLIRLESGECYVGSAYGDVGLWARWSAYSQSKHGGNVELRRLNEASDGAFIEDAQFTLLEAWPARTEDSVILGREGYWKVALGSREFGLNKN